MKKPTAILTAAALVLPGVAAASPGKYHVPKPHHHSHHHHLMAAPINPPPRRCSIHFQQTPTTLVISVTRCTRHRRIRHSRVSAVVSARTLSFVAGPTARTVRLPGHAITFDLVEVYVNGHKAKMFAQGNLTNNTSLYGNGVALRFIERNGYARIVAFAFQPTRVRVVYELKS